jgi:TonB family protein
MILRRLIVRPAVLRASIIRPPARRSFHALALLAVLVGSAAPAEEPYTDSDRDDALTCRMLLWVTPAGVVQAAQVVRSAGTSPLDAMCLNGVITRQLKPPSKDGSSTGGWVTFTLGLMMKLPHKEAQAAQVRPELPIPALASDRPLELNRFLDAAADTRRPPRVCALHVLVSADGTVDRLSVTRSTGSPPLDAACLAVIRAAAFVPAQRDRQPVAAATDIWLNWQSPD